jgi:AcrR family transcriptional regulator
LRGAKEAATIRGVAAAKATTTPTVYSYYADREALLTALRALAFQRFSAYLAKSRDFRHVCARHLEFGTSHPRDYELLYGRGWMERVTADAQSGEIERYTTHILRAGVDESRAAHIAYPIMMVLRGVVMHRLLNKKPRSPRPGDRRSLSKGLHDAARQRSAREIPSAVDDAVRRGAIRAQGTNPETAVPNRIPDGAQMQIPQRPKTAAGSIWWGKKDSNLRSHKTADLQSAPFATRDTPPERHRTSATEMVVERPWMTLKTRARNRAPGRRVYGRSGVAKSTKGGVNILNRWQGLGRFQDPKLPLSGTRGTTPP